MLVNNIEDLWKSFFLEVKQRDRGLVRVKKKFTVVSAHSTLMRCHTRGSACYWRTAHDVRVCDMSQ